jgi:hypothetical protein|eukprot:Transcript_15596.p3 GENE.Transcript_15596~~Transcript_15596.p3  ORF type:complete len:94 (+),score=39.21 Transcript_15596:98-379(+)
MPKPAKPKGKKGRGADMKLIGAVGGGLAALLTLGLGAAYLMQGGGSPPLPAAKKAAAAGPSLYEMSATTMDGESVSISSFRGKALLMLNVASR